MSEPAAGFTPLAVSKVEAIARGIHAFELRAASGGELPPFTPGAHVTVRTPNGLLRKYSLCNDPAERDRYQIAVKREVNGRGGSIDLIDNARAGDTLLVAAPVNDFGLPPRGQDFLFIAGGIGVTPMRAMIHELRGAGKRFRLFYFNRTPEMAAFRDELSTAELKDSVVIHYDQGDPAR